MSVEDRKKERIKKTVKTILENNPITGISVRVANLLKGKLTKEKEITIDSIIKDLKSEEKLSKGDRGTAEAIPKKEFDKSVLISKIRKGMKNAKPAFRGITSARQSKGSVGMTQQEMRASNDKKFKGHTGRG